MLVGLMLFTILSAVIRLALCITPASLTTLMP